MLSEQPDSDHKTIPMSSGLLTGASRRKMGRPHVTARWRFAFSGTLVDSKSNKKKTLDLSISPEDKKKRINTTGRKK